MRFRDIVLPILFEKLGPIDGFTDIWCKLMRLRSHGERYESDGRIGQQLQDQCDQLASALEQISDATNSSKLFQCQMMYG